MTPDELQAHTIAALSKGHAFALLEHRRDVQARDQRIAELERELEAAKAEAESAKRELAARGPVPEPEPDLPAPDLPAPEPG